MSRSTCFATSTGSSAVKSRPVNLALTCSTILMAFLFMFSACNESPAAVCPTSATDFKDFLWLEWVSSTVSKLSPCS
ncbi:hypothetical protein DPMN_018056 [Dreissena polymorpha]|uniref:Uncharacterized protein n=1 Tax=Dreissena polymorpha TaxID=45954 RepID=A0A9D4NHP7_DREPO|nr:hypothetical protein DPMN_018056 [Dreissena polymorpha]